MAEQLSHKQQDTGSKPVAPTMDFIDCVIECSKNTGFVKEYNRLTGSHFQMPDNRPGIIRAIDQATGYQKELDKQDDLETVKFVAFVYDTVWSTLPSRLVR